MVASNREAAIKKTLQYEGGYSNHPADPGGPTNWGITIADARKYWKAGATADDVKAMPQSVAVEIYRKRYWDAVGGDNLPPGSTSRCSTSASIRASRAR
jgi:lysozyme family protein